MPAPSVTWVAQGSICARAGRLPPVGEQPVAIAPGDRHRHAAQLLGRLEAVAARTRPARRPWLARPTRRASVARASCDGQPRREAERLGEQRDAPGAGARERFHGGRAGPRACPRAAFSESWQKRSSGPVQKPAGENAHAERIAPPARELERDRPAHRVARHVRALEAELGEEPLERVRVGGDRGLDPGRQRRRAAEARASRMRSRRTRPRAGRSPAAMPASDGRRRAAARPARRRPRGGS